MLSDAIIKLHPVKCNGDMTLDVYYNRCGSTSKRTNPNIQIYENNNSGAQNFIIQNPIDNYVVFKKANCEDNSYLKREVHGTNVLLKEFEDCNVDHCMPDLNHDNYLWTINYV